MNILIVDDEPLAIRLLENYISRVPGLHIAGRCSNALEAFQALKESEIDVIYLDIHMPEISGMAFLKMLKNPPGIVFTTAYTQYAAESYDLNVIDYLVKPIAFDRFMKSVDKFNVASPAAGQKNNDDEALFVRADGRNIKVVLHKLYFIEGYKNYVRLWTDTGKLIVHDTMKNFEQYLKPYPVFLRVHKSYIVNINHVTEVSGSNLKAGGSTIPIGASYTTAVQNALQRYRLQSQK